MRPPPTGRLFLIGARGAGKSSVGRHLAAALGWEFVDADDELERRAGKSIREVFAEDGEPAFRDLEEAVLADLAGRSGVVVATGGGCVLREANRRRLAAGYTVWLTADPATASERIRSDPATAGRRPPLAGGGPGEVREVMAAREPLYRAAADLTLPTDDLSPRELALAILQGWSDSSSTTPT